MSFVFNVQIVNSVIYIYIYLYRIKCGFSALKMLGFLAALAFQAAHCFTKPSATSTGVTYGLQGNIDYGCTLNIPSGSGRKTARDNHRTFTTFSLKPRVSPLPCSITRSFWNMQASETCRSPTD